MTKKFITMLIASVIISIIPVGLLFSLNNHKAKIYHAVPPENPIKLFADFTIYQPVSDVIDKLKAQGYSGIHSESYETFPKTWNTNYPPVRHDILIIEPYSHLRFEGKLMMTFFNNQLFRADFSPNENTYFKAFNKERGTNLEPIPGSETLCSDRISLRIVGSERKWIMATDTELSNEVYSSPTEGYMESKPLEHFSQNN